MNSDREKELQKVWWGVSLAVSICFLIAVAGSAFGPEPTTVDLLVVAVFFALLLAGAFPEISLGGVSLKRELAEIKEDLTRQIQMLQMEVRSTASATSQLTQNLFVPPSDEALQRQLEPIRRQLDRVLAQRGVGEERIPEVTDPVLRLASLRIELERELRALWEARVSFGFRELGRKPMGALLWDLRKAEVIDADLAALAKELYAVCSAAVHGEEPTEAQRRFAEETGPAVISLLRDIRNHGGGEDLGLAIAGRLD